MKKATKKRDRKYGKKPEEVIEEVKVKKQKKEKVKLMIDYGMVREFPSRELAEKFIKKQHKEADKSNRPKSSFIYI